ncbi:DM13 domain-containing protein [Fulvivirga sp. 29W222]|uniref:DM13 domain-containing protein n=1 Tax=Fulvivirga marina TaxID=2494733 RepID=A0A937FYU6_9BACT|nr:DM13 domain-containing protein [Fulvivirga marina]MBL6447508.1 DM13 domain-containing protein [Fulvivirga marina]
MKRIFAILLILTGCIGTDIIDDEMEEKIVIESPLTSLKVGETHQFSAKYFNNIGKEEQVVFVWTSSDESIISIDNTGLATALKTGTVTLNVLAEGISAALKITASNETSGEVEQRTASLSTVSSYPLSGDVILKKGANGLILEFADNFNTTSALPGLYVYLSNNINTINGALEVAKVAKFSGAQSYEISTTSDLFQYNIVLFYCKPFVVPVGNGKLNP